MSAEDVIYALVSGAGPVTAIVGERIYPVVLAQGQPLPAIVYSLVTVTRPPAIDAAAPTHLARSRIQLDLMARDYPTLQALRAAVVAALQFQRGVIAGTTVHSVLHAGEGATQHDGELQVYYRPIDFIVTHQQ